MARPIRLLLFEGPGEVDRLRAALIGRQWCLLVNLTPDEAVENWPALKEIWQKRDVTTVNLGPRHTTATRPSDQEDPVLEGRDFRAEVVADEIRPDLKSLVVELPHLVIAIGRAAATAEPLPGRDRCLILDASWSHTSSFPDREEVRTAMKESLAAANGARVHFISDLSWDLHLFEAVASETGHQSSAAPVAVAGSARVKLWQARQYLPQVKPDDTVLIGLAPGRDDRGAYQRLRSDFAERTVQVRSFPTVPLSTGPGMSREEALETVGMWLPARVLVAGGPLSEQVLLARHLEENTGGSQVVVGARGGEYRLPEFDLIRHVDTGHRDRGTPRLRGLGARAGLVVVTLGHDEGVMLAGAGLPDGVEAVLPKIKVNRRGKTPEQLVREVEMAFSSRGLPVPVVRFLG